MTSMQVENLKAAMEEARRFLRFGEEALVRQAKEDRVARTGMTPRYRTREAAQVRRASLDLPHVLTRFRQL